MKRIGIRKNCKKSVYVLEDPLFGNIKLIQTGYINGANVYDTLKDENGNKNKVKLQEYPAFEFEAEFEINLDFERYSDFVPMKVIGEDITLYFKSYNFIKSLKFAKNNKNGFKLLDGVCSFYGKFYFDFANGYVDVVPLESKK